MTDTAQAIDDTYDTVQPEDRAHTEEPYSQIEDGWDECYD